MPPPARVTWVPMVIAVPPCEAAVTLSASPSGSLSPVTPSVITLPVIEGPSSEAEPVSSTATGGSLDALIVKLTFVVVVPSKIATFIGKTPSLLGPPCLAEASTIPVILPSALRINPAGKTSRVE